MQALILTLLLNHSAPGAVPAADLANKIIEISSTYHLDPLMLTRMVLQESKGLASAYNGVSHDHGLMQINQKTAIALGLTPTCLYNWQCNLEAAASILAQLAKYSDFSPCHYNTGRLGAKRRAPACLEYNNRLAEYR